MPGGRPSSFDESYIAGAEGLCRIGALDEDLADAFGVHVATIYEWKKAHPEFAEAIKRGKAVEDQNVAAKLIERAKGSTWIEQKEVKLKRAQYENGKKVLEEEWVEVVDLRKSAPPDTPAMIFFLKNRRPDLWRDKQDVVHAADKDAPPVFTLKIDNS